MSYQAGVAGSTVYSTSNNNGGIPSAGNTVYSVSNNERSGDTFTGAPGSTVYSSKSNRDTIYTSSHNSKQRDDDHEHEHSEDAADTIYEGLPRSNNFAHGGGNGGGVSRSPISTMFHPNQVLEEDRLTPDAIAEGLSSISFSLSCVCV